MRFLLLLVAAVIAVFAGIAAMQLSSPSSVSGSAATAQAPATTSVATVDVIVAKAPIAPGTMITAAMIDRQPWPENLVLDGFIVGNSPAAAAIIGKVTRSPFQTREPLIVSKLASTKDTGFLAANLPQGSRAVTIATDAITGVAGFVYAGDRVDIVFTHNVPADIRAASAASAPQAGPAGAAPTAAASEKPGFAEILASNVPVLAVNLREGVTDTAGGAAVSSAAVSISPSSMTLQVTDVQAKKLRLAEKVGTLSVALRSINDRDNNTITGPADLVSLTQVTAQEAPQEQDNSVHIVRGGDFGAAQGGQRIQGGR